MTTIRTLRKLTKVAAELEQLTRTGEQLARAMESLGEAATPQLAKLAEAARQAPVKWRIERA